MTLAPAYDDGTVRVYHAEHAALAAHLRETGERPDAMIVDAPYSERTHAGHDGQAASLGSPVLRKNGRAEARYKRREIDYPAWSPEDVAAFCATWAPLIRNWIVSITDEDLRGPWRVSLSAEGLLAFARVPAIETGATVRFNGDGTPNWTTDIVAARTRDPRHQGAWSPPPYHLGPSEPKPWVGGKPVWLIRRLVLGYSRPGDLIVDPCCGAGTLGVAVRYEGRRAILADKDPAAVETTIKRLRGERTKPTRDDYPETPEQPALFGRTGT